MISIVPLGDTNISSKETHFSLFSEATGGIVNNSQVSRTFNVAKWKQRVSVIPCKRVLSDILLAVQISNVVLFTVPQSGIDEIGFETLRIIRAQGFPALIVAVEATEAVQQYKKAAEKQLCYEFGEKSIKTTLLSKPAEVLRGICQISLREEAISKFIPRPYLMVEEPPVFFQNGDQQGAEISGYLRGGSLNANQLIHFPGFGDFQIHAILSVEDPHPSKIHKDAMDEEIGDRTVLSTAIPGKQDSLQVENDPDPLDGEQTMWSNQVGLEKKPPKLVPKGTSSYQATWIVEEGDELESELPIHEGEVEKEMMLEAPPLVPLNESDDEEYEYLNEEEKNIMMESKRQLEQEDIDYPDQVETPDDIPARVRFQRYRGLKSFRQSPWDPKEELPRDYAKIFQFRSMIRTQNRILDEHEGVSSGTYITIQVMDTPRALIEQYLPESPLVGVGLFQYERKMSVLNFTVRRTSNYTEPIASKDELIFVCGGRRILCNPLFSEHSSTLDKHKYEKFWLPTTTSVATIYGPAMFTPTPVLVFKHVAPGEVENCIPVDGLVLVGSGSLLSVDPDRLNIKKITLTGEPFKVLKRKAVVRKMFHNPGKLILIFHYYILIIGYRGYSMV